MAPSSGYHLVPKAVDAIRAALSRSSAYVRHRLGRPVELVPARVPAGGVHPIPRIAALRQAASRRSTGFTQQLRQFGSAANRKTTTTTNASRASFPLSATRAALSRSTFAPFASPLRPNLTGGALPRSAGGYGLGGSGARHFSHVGGGAHQHVAQNVHAAVRAFCLNGFAPLYDGPSKRDGAARFRAVRRETCAARANMSRHAGLDPWAVRGTSLDFKIAPTVTALGAAAEKEHGEEEGLAGDAVLSGLAADFARQTADLAAVHRDLKRLAALGALPVAQIDAATLRVRFAGCDGDAVARLCDELGITRGVVREDEAWRVEEEEEEDEEVDELGRRGGPRRTDAEMALLFPWAPSEPGGDALEWRSMLDAHSASASEACGSAVLLEREPASPGLWCDEGFVSVPASDADEHESVGVRALAEMPAPAPHGFDGVEGIYRFLLELERAELR